MHDFPNLMQSLSELPFHPHMRTIIIHCTQDHVAITVHTRSIAFKLSFEYRGLGLGIVCCCGLTGRVCIVEELGLFLPIRLLLT